nr:MAG TPA: hypothetical protein [Caudoviricetes sp.]
MSLSNILSPPFVCFLLGYLQYTAHFVSCKDIF